MRWRTAHHRRRRQIGLQHRSVRRLTWDYLRRRASWEAMRKRLAEGPPVSAGPMVDTFRREMAKLRADPAAFADLVAPQFRLHNYQRVVLDKVARHVRAGRPLIIGVDLARR